MKIIYSKHSNICQIEETTGNTTTTSNTITKRVIDILIFIAVLFSASAVFGQGTNAYALKAENADMSTMINMEVIAQTGFNTINWTISKESNPCIYVIERSTNGINFDILGKVDGIVKSNTENYSYNDKNSIAGATFYRMIKVCLNGAYNYTGIYPVNEFGNGNEIQNASTESNKTHTDAAAIKPTSSVAVNNSNR